MRKKKEKRNDKVTIGLFFSVQIKIVKELFSKHKFMTTVIVLLSASMMAEQVIELKLLEYVTNNVYTYINGSGSEFVTLLMYLGLFMGMLLVMKIVRSIYRAVVERYESKVIFESEQKIISKLSSISYENYESNDFYEKVNLSRQASGQYSQAIYGITQIVNIVFMTIMYGVLLSRINLLYVLIIFICITVSIVMSSRTTDMQLNFWRKHVSPDERKRSYFMNVFGNRINHQNIQANRAFSYFGDKYKLYNSCVKSNYLKLNLFSFSTELFTSMMFLLSYLLAAFLVGNGIVNGDFEIGYFSMVMALLSNMFMTLKNFAMFILNRNWYVRVLDAYYGVLAMPDAVHETPPAFAAAIEMKNVTYRYAQAQSNALNGISPAFRRSQKIAVVGENGSGKSTMISIVLNLLQSYEGEYRCENIRKTAILQDFIQYQLTVRENIEVGSGGNPLSDSNIYDILKRVDLYDFVMSKPDGIDTRLGQLEEDGVELSKGQWQRLAIARLLADDSARVWVLDEPTSYLDPISEIEMYNLVFNLAEDRLVFFISHRLGFAKKADSIVVLSDGVIVETGTHSELMKKNDGRYMQMYNLQREWYA